MLQVTCQLESGGGTILAAAPGENVLALLRNHGIAMDTPCSGVGTCGKCRVRLIAGQVAAAPSVSLSDEDYADGWRLACQSHIIEDVTILLPAAALAYQSNMRTADLSDADEVAIFERLRDGLAATGLPFTGSIRTIPVSMDAPTLSDTMSDVERLIRATAAALNTDAIVLDGSVVRRLPGTLRESQFTVRVVVDISSAPIRILGVLPPSGNVRALGLAIDIGTTTVTGVLVDTDSGEIVAKASAGNCQIRFGADVISRIIEQNKPGGAKRMQRAVMEETLLPLIHNMCAFAEASSKSIYSACIVGNTAMQHLLLGVTADPLRMEPYIPAFFALDPFPATMLGLPLNPAAHVRLAPNIGSYVGGDVTAGTLVTGMWNAPDLTLFIDLGTNGEIVLGNNEFLMACACSAGPAFEGGDISCGMRATNGAIESVAIDRDTQEPTLTVIGDTAPTGLCGSGIIDCIAELFRCGVIDARGKFVLEDGKRVRADASGMRRYILVFADPARTQHEVFIDEVDIDNFIRAKGAIFSGIQTLLSTLALSVDDIGHILVAGGIGSGINLRAAVRIGMLPHISEERFAYIGNSALAGAYAMLMSAGASAKLMEIARGITYVELSTEPAYMDAFVAACFLPHTDSSLFPPAAEDAP